MMYCIRRLKRPFRLIDTALAPPNHTDITSLLAGLEQGIFVTQVLAAVGLSEANNTGGVESSALCSAASADTEAQRNVVHGVDNQALVFGAVL